MIASIDGGKHKCAIAEWSGTGDRARCVDTYFLAVPNENGAPPSAYTIGERCDLTIIEKPRITSNTKNWESVLDCAWGGALVAGLLGAPVITYAPNAWKASVKKPIHHMRLWSVMTPKERALWPAAVPQIIEQACKTLAKTGKVRAYSHEWHNTLDAWGIGAVYFGRIGRGGRELRPSHGS